MERRGAEEYADAMDRNEVISRVREHEAQLRKLGVERLSVFGSTARGEAKAGSDIDLAVVLDRSLVGLLRLSRLNAIRDLLACEFGQPVDVVEEPTAPRSPLKRELSRDAIRAI